MTCTAEGERIAPMRNIYVSAMQKAVSPQVVSADCFVLSTVGGFFYQIQFQATMVVLLVYTPPECVSLRGTATLHSILGVEYSTLSITTKIIIKILKYIY